MPNDNQKMPKLCHFTYSMDGIPEDLFDIDIEVTTNEDPKSNKKESKEKKKARCLQERKEDMLKVEKRLKLLYPDVTLTKDRVCDIALHCRAEMMKRKIDSGATSDPAIDKNSRQVERNKYVALSYLYKNWDEACHFIKQLVFRTEENRFAYPRIDELFYGPLEN